MKALQLQVLLLCTAFYASSAVRMVIDGPARIIQCPKKGVLGYMNPTTVAPKIPPAGCYSMDRVPCSDFPDGENFPHPEYCNKFWKCVGGEVVVKTCNSGKLYNHLTGWCEYTMTREDCMCPIEINYVAFYEAAKDGNIDYVENILAQVKHDSDRLNDLLTWCNKDHYNNTAMAAASWKGQDEVVISLLKVGQNPNESCDGVAPMYSAAMWGRTGVIRILLQPEYQADINIQTSDGWTPVYVAARNGETEALKILIEHGADIHKLTNEGWSPLMRASRLGNEDVVQILLDAGARVQYAAPKGTTALHLAAKNNNEGVVRLLLQNGADKSQQNRKRQTAADWAREADYDDLAELIDNWQ